MAADWCKLWCFLWLACRALEWLPQDFNRYLFTMRWHAVTTMHYLWYRCTGWIESCVYHWLPRRSTLDHLLCWFHSFFTLWIWGCVWTFFSARHLWTLTSEATLPPVVVDFSWLNSHHHQCVSALETWMQLRQMSNSLSDIVDIVPACDFNFQASGLFPFPIHFLPIDLVPVFQHWHELG